MKNIYIGPIIKQKLYESPYSVAQFARKIGRSRKSVYDLFKDKSIDVDLLCRISVLLNYNFLHIYTMAIRQRISFQLDKEESNKKNEKEKSSI